MSGKVCIYRCSSLHMRPQAREGSVRRSQEAKFLGVLRVREARSHTNSDLMWPAAIKRGRGKFALSSAQLNCPIDSMFFFCSHDRKGESRRECIRAFDTARSRHRRVA